MLDDGDEFSKFESHLEEIARELPGLFPAGIRASDWREKLEEKFKTSANIDCASRVLEEVKEVRPCGRVVFPEAKKLPGVQKDFEACLARVMQ